MFEKVDVNGDNKHPAWHALKNGKHPEDLEWNFSKFLVRGDGAIMGYYGPKEEPNSILPDIEKLLA